MTIPTSPRLFRLTSFIATACLLVAWAAAQNPAPATPAKGQLHQIGFVWLNEPGSAADRQKIIDAVHQFGREIPEVKSVAVGKSDGISDPYTDASYDVSFILTFESEAARLRYNAHPVHEKAAKEVFLPLSKKFLFYRFIAE